MEEFEQRYQKLNEEQKKAVDAIEGPVLVIAGPGSGKTEILGLRVANILKEVDVYPSNILCLTFTDSAAVNMRERLKGLIGPEAYNVAIHTFHSLGRDIRNYHPEIFYRRDIFTSADELTQLDILEDIFNQLSYNNPLAKTHPDRGYLYITEAKRSIEHLKKAGLTPKEFLKILNHNEQSLKFLNPLIDEAFGSRISKDLFDELPPIVEKMKKHEVDEFPVDHMKPLVPVVAGSLERALNKAVSRDKTSPLTEWKNNWTYKTKDGDRAMKETKYLEKMKALASVYKTYNQEMEQRGYYDFDDMILDVIKAIEENDELRYELQEQFQYILVDEFQDTNDAQMRLLHLLTGAEVQEGRPNLMVVGDDDQAIFKFQGAEISNILKFQERYREPRIITLTKNYRSRQDILDVARHIITQGDERLENSISEVEKELEAEKEKEGDITSKSFPAKSHQYYWIAQEINDLIESGLDPEKIAVIGREHKHLKNLVPHLANFGIPVNYERQRDVLQEPHIRQLIKMARFVYSLINPDQEDADHLLPEILSYPFWGLDREKVWQLSRKAYKEEKPWLECMEEEGGYLAQIRNFFLELSTMAQHEPLERVLDKMVGAKMHIAPESEDEDIEEKPKEEEFTSPFKDYYFAPEKFEEDPVEYLTFLSSLRSFIKALRHYQKGEIIGLEDLLDFVNTHQDNDMTLPDQSTFASAQNAVRLLTAHKAKGSEFDTVFVLNCQDKVWAGRKRGSKLPFPSNLPIAPAGDNKDDQLRLFYVALTRAARNLYLTSYEIDDFGREKNRLQFLAPPEENKDLEANLEELLEPDKVSEEMKDPEVETGIITSSWESYHHPPFEGDEEVLLETVLENYKMSVTHFNNFLNVRQGGPQTFLEQNLLRFPQPKTPALSFGTAMHRTISQTYNHLKKKEDLPPKNQILDWFEEFLHNERLSEQDFKTYLQRGKDALRVFFDQREDSFDLSHMSEFNFRNEEVVVNEVPLTGKIDKMEFSDEEVTVWDFKTGSALEKWGKGSQYDKVKSWKYQNQLIFYKFLVENSRKFSDYEVNKGIIEFLEPEDGEIKQLEFSVKGDRVERLRKLLPAVYNKIMNLEFPDAEDYEDNIKGIKEFEEDLLDG
ncbi:MAG: ATP-dependent DNA helicase [Candidatus Paceibacterota bacterium]